MLYYDILRTSLNTFDHRKLYSQIEIDRIIELEKTEEIFMVVIFWGMPMTKYKIRRFKVEAVSERLYPCWKSQVL